MPSPVARPSLVTETARALRQAIRVGEYVHVLPPERHLSLTLNVSRPTLRAALASLEKEGLIDKQGCNARKTLIRTPRGRRRASLRMRTVHLLQVNVPESSRHIYLDRNVFLAEQLWHLGIDFRVDSIPARGITHPHASLESLIQSRPADLWLLQLSTEPMQRWFQERQIPCIVIGSVFPGIDFASLDVDYRATCRHAAGMFLARGHRSLAILCPRLMRVGDRASLAGFQEGIDMSGQADAVGIEMTCDDTVAGACAATDALLLHPRRPEGWLVLKARTFMTVFTCLARRGLRIGDQISLVCRDPDMHFPALVPTAAHYRHEHGDMNRRLLRMIQEQLEGVSTRDVRYLVQSRYEPGDSLR